MTIGGQDEQESKSATRAEDVPTQWRLQTVSVFVFSLAVRLRDSSRRAMGGSRKLVTHVPFTSSWISISFESMAAMVDPSRLIACSKLNPVGMAGAETQGPDCSMYCVPSRKGRPAACSIVPG